MSRTKLRVLVGGNPAVPTSSFGVKGVVHRPMLNFGITAFAVPLNDAEIAALQK